MKFEHRDREYELMLMVEPNKNESFDIIGIFKVKYVVIKGDVQQGFQKIEVSKFDEYDFEDYEYINYFCNQDDELENIKIAKEYIDDYFKTHI